MDNINSAARARALAGRVLKIRMIFHPDAQLTGETGALTRLEAM